MRTKLIAANWKMNTTLADAHVLADGVRNQTEHLEHIEVVLCPPTIWLSELAHTISPGQFNQLRLGAQNMYPEEKGPFTGEISPLMVKAVAEYVILGHSERTHLFHEEAGLIARKIRSALDHHLKIILCVGEDNPTENDNRQIIEQLTYYVHGLSEAEKAAITIAYEPVWAIGSGTPATPEQAEKAAQVLRTLVTEQTRIVYGGSVTVENANGFLAQPDIDGFLIGGTSLRLKDFLTICEYANNLSIPNQQA